MDDYRRLNAQWQERERQLDADIAAVREVSASSPYAATESVAAYLFEDLGMEDVTPQGYLQAVSNESEPGPADLKAFSDLLAEGDARLLVVNSQHGDAAGGQLSDAARAADVPVLEVGSSCPTDATMWWRGWGRWSIGSVICWTDTGGPARWMRAKSPNGRGRIRESSG